MTSKRREAIGLQQLQERITVDCDTVFNILNM